MNFFIKLIILLLISKISFTQNLFDTNEYILQFNSQDITLEKINRINEIKIKSFDKIISNILTKEDYLKINTTNIFFINNFILNIKINNEKIINNNYFSNISINFNKKLIIDYLIDNKISFVDYLPSKFLIIIFEQDNITDNLLSKDNRFYKYLLNNNNNNNLLKNFFLIPDLDHNDRYIYDKNNFLDDNFIQNNKLNNKYETNYQILLHSTRTNKVYYNEVFLFYNNKKYLIFDNQINKLNYDNLFNQIKINSLNKWKQINKIDTSIVNDLDCKININNISELTYVRNKLQSNLIVKKLNLKTIQFNKNTYQILFFGARSVFIKSLERDRLKLFINDNSCSIKLI